MLNIFTEQRTTEKVNKSGGQKGVGYLIADTLQYLELLFFRSFFTRSLLKLFEACKTFRGTLEEALNQIRTVCTFKQKIQIRFSVERYESPTRAFFKCLLM